MSEHNTLELTADTFDATIGEGVTLVDFWAPWCGPCQTQGPIIEELAGETADGVRVAKINVDEHQDPAARYNVMSIPTLIVFKDGEEVERFIGVQDKAVLASALEKAAS